MTEEWTRDGDPAYALADALEVSWEYGDIGPFKLHLSGAEAVLSTLDSFGWRLVRDPSAAFSAAKLEPGAE